MFACLMKCITKGYIGFKISIKLWAGPWPDASWKWNYKFKGSKETAATYRSIWASLRWFVLGA
ncbi:hypothetical protein COCVIDRAFT_96099 [Bipolaris victoriae FI3]|uniref:Uncharacterized protein n=2 Tax=Bipolaris TaxID=33194 RepID=W6YP19_COCC2|nr:uncharacterized protein COCCADRAFT_33510 [Bipolaris zeicola 26-R-13]XP_014557856.1 hypothetical protein COCVIDRAFT_96099 [Bipolaris victoriae FI3]EUC37244.1 hypothetical protein COCCADRAFT_33510 [Bipolaris zeicola 26-R-13]